VAARQLVPDIATTACAAPEAQIEGVVPWFFVHEHPAPLDDVALASCGTALVGRHRRNQVGAQRCRVNPCRDPSTSPSARRWRG
jgi:hypothetical protein